MTTVQHHPAGSGRPPVLPRRLNYPEDRWASDVSVLAWATTAGEIETWVRHPADMGSVELCDHLVALWDRLAMWRGSPRRIDPSCPDIRVPADAPRTRRPEHTLETPWSNLIVGEDQFGIGPPHPGDVDGSASADELTRAAMTDLVRVSEAQRTIFNG